MTAEPLTRQRPSTVAAPTTADYPVRLKSFVYLITS